MAVRKEDSHLKEVSKLITLSNVLNIPTSAGTLPCLPAHASSTPQRVAGWTTLPRASQAEDPGSAEVSYTSPSCRA